MRYKKVFVSMFDSLDIENLILPLRKVGFEVEGVQINPDEAKNLVSYAKGFDIVIASGETWSKEVVLELKDTLKLIIKYGTGIDNIDINACTEAGIAVANTAGENALAVAEVAVCHMLMLTRQTFSTGMDIKLGSDQIMGYGYELFGKTIGLIGMGNVGKHVVKMLKGFNIKFLVHDVVIDKKVIEEYGVEYTDMETLCRKSDFISLHIPLNDGTCGMVNRDFINRMKSTAFLINTSRGAIINESDLYEALVEKRIAGVGLDVLVNEPPTIKDPLVGLKNVIITPHIGASSYEAESRVSKYICESIFDFSVNNIMPRTHLNPGCEKFHM